MIMQCVCTIRAVTADSDVTLAFVTVRIHASTELFPCCIGVNAPRSKASNGQDLPSSRLVSSVFATDANQPHENLTLLVMQWGQFVDHDLTHTPIQKGEWCQ